MTLTQNGKSMVVIVEAHTYQRMRDRLALLEDVYTAEMEVEAGVAIAHEDAKARIVDRLNA